MKLNRYILACAAAASLFAAQSCLKEQADIFETSSSERLQAYIEETRSVFTSAENGWIMEYYPGTGQAFGGYAYYLTFTDTEVEAISELDPENSYKSLYKITNDNGAVLSFDTNNPALHYFATPSSSEYQAKGGDFEFTITTVSPEKIGLRGKRSGNHYDLYPYSSELAPKQYISKVVEMSEGMRAAIIEGTIGETEVSGTIDFDTRRITFSYEVENNVVSESGETETVTDTVVVKVPYMYTDTGLKAYEPVKVAGYTIDLMYYHSGNNVLTTGSVVFAGKLPEDYTPYNDFIGSYTLTTQANGFGPYQISLTPNEANDGFILSGMNKNFTLDVSYNKAKGRLVLGYQVIGTTTGSNYAAWCPWDAESGYLTWTAGVGMEIYRDMSDPTGTTFRFKDNGVWETYNCDSFIIYEFNSAGTAQGGYSGYGEYRYPYFYTLKRK